MPTCPAQDDLTAYLLGDLASEQRESIAAHVDTCPACQTTLASLSGVEDELVAALRQQPSPERYTEERDFLQAVARLTRLDPAVAQASSASSLSAGSPSPLMGEGRGEGFPAGGEGSALGSIGPYRLLSKLGEGGMGAVYKALHTKLKRVVAIKVLPIDRVADARAVARFEREMEAVGRLDHPHLVRSHDAGEHAGTHYLVMEYVEGEDLSHLVRRHGPLPIADACEIIRQAALGLQYAHEHGLVHRDIKPSNLMLTASGGREPPGSAAHQPANAGRSPSALIKILDLGLALLNEDRPGEELTGTCQMMGTADYIAPEQAHDSHGVDIRADLYSLGCTLFKLLTGHAPYSGPQHTTTLSKMMAHAAAPIPNVRDIRPEVPPDLAALVARLMSKDPAARYATPAQLAATLAPFTSGHDLGALVAQASSLSPLTVVPSTDPRSIGTDAYLSSASHSTAPNLPLPLGEGRGEGVSNAGSSNAAAPSRKPTPRQLIATAVAALVLLAGIIVIIRDQSGKELARVRAPDSASVTIKHEEATPTEQSQPDRQPAAGAVSVAAPASPPQTTISPSAPLTPMALVTHPVPIRGLKGWTVETTAHRGELYAAKYSPDGRFVATGGGDGVVRLWTPSAAAIEPKLVRALLGHSGVVRAVSWSPDGKSFASAGDDKTVVVWDLASGRLRHRLEWHSREVLALAWSPNSQSLASGGGDKGIHVWALDTGRPLAILLGHKNAITGLSWSSQNKMLASGSKDNDVRLWDATAGQLIKVLSSHTGPVNVNVVAWSPDGRTLVSGSDSAPDPTTIIWNIETGVVQRTLPVAANSISWSPQGKTLAYASGRQIFVWDPESERPPRQLPQGGRIVDWAPDGKSLISIDYDGLEGIRFRNVESDQTQAFIKGNPAYITAIAWSPDNRNIVLGWDNSNKALVCDPRTAETPVTAEGDRSVTSVCWSPDGKELGVSSQYRGYVCGARAVKERLRFEWDTVRVGAGMAWSPDGQSIAYIDNTLPAGCLRIVNSGTGSVINTLKSLDGHEKKRLESLAWSPDGRRLAAGLYEGRSESVLIWDVESSQVIHVLEGHKSNASSLAWSPDGTTLLSGDTNASIRCWDAESGKPMRAPVKPPGGGSISALAWYPDSSKFASSNNTFIRLWDATTGAQLRVIQGHQAAITGLSLSSDGTTLTSCGQDGTIRFWDPETGNSRGMFVALRESQVLALSPQGHYRGSPQAQRELVYVALTDDGEQLTLTPAEFAAKYGWKNDPEQVRLVEETGNADLRGSARIGTTRRNY